jgi:hypothetical protein
VDELVNLDVDVEGRFRRLTRLVFHLRAHDRPDVTEEERSRWEEDRGRWAAQLGPRRAHAIACDEVLAWFREFRICLHCGAWDTVHMPDRIDEDGPEGAEERLRRLLRWGMRLSARAAAFPEGHRAALVTEFDRLHDEFEHLAARVGARRADALGQEEAAVVFCETGRCAWCGERHVLHALQSNGECHR